MLFLGQLQDFLCNEQIHIILGDFKKDHMVVTDATKNVRELELSDHYAMSLELRDIC